MSAAFAARVRSALAETRARIRSFSGARGGGSETLLAYDRLFEPLNGLEGRARLYSQVHPDPALRATCEEFERELALLRTDLSLDRAVFERLAGVVRGDLASPEEQRLHAHVLRDFRRSGVDREESVRARIRLLNQEIVELEQTFGRNILLGGRDHVVRGGHAGLRGLPADFLASHPEREDGTVLLSTDPSDRIPVLTWAEDAALRRDYFLCCMNRAAPENLAVLARLLEKRHELSRALGYAHWADYVTEDKMTKDARTARAFVERVHGLVRRRAETDRTELLAEKRRDFPDARQIFEWERGYWAEKAKLRLHDFDSRSVRAYFPVESVKRGVLATSERLFALGFHRADVEVWHPSVEAYDVVDGGTTLARLYLDLHPRAGKYKHAAMFPIADGVAGGALPEAALVTNFTAPAEGRPALLVHDQVRTFFHEFGHLLHHVFGGSGAFQSFSGIANEHDFVEVPSQLFEEWAWSPEVLATFARHCETDRTIPAELVQRMRAAEEYGKGLLVAHQAFLAALSLHYHERDPAGLDPEVEYVELKRAWVPLPHEEGNRFPASFGHLRGYSAMYYTYLWSLVIAKDLFGRFEGCVLDRETARRYRQAVLAPGGSKDGAELVRDFLGRDFRFDAFERWLAS